jgi:hypothetical protein
MVSMNLAYPAGHWILLWSWVSLGMIIGALGIAAWLVVDSRQNSRASVVARVAIVAGIAMTIPFTFARLVPGFALTLDEADFLDIAAYLPFASYALVVLGIFLQLRAKVRYVCPNGHPVDPAWESCPRCGADLVEFGELEPIQIAAGAGAGEPELQVEGAGPEAITDFRGRAYLRPLRGPGPVPDCELGMMTKIGRSGERNHFRLKNDELVSREHLSVVFSGTHFLARDLGSANGTIVNGMSITEHRLADGDEIQIGETVFRFVWDPEDLPVPGDPSQ